LEICLWYMITLRFLLDRDNHIGPAALCGRLDHSILAQAEDVDSRLFQIETVMDIPPIKSPSRRASPSLQKLTWRFHDGSRSADHCLLDHLPAPISSDQNHSYCSGIYSKLAVCISTESTNRTKKLPSVRFGDDHPHLKEVKSSVHQSLSRVTG